MRAMRVNAVARKEFLHILRDPRSLGMAIALPVLMLVLFGYALTMDVDLVPVAVWDQSRTPASRELISAFVGSRYFRLSAHVQSYPQIEAAIDGQEALLALIIPGDYARRVGSGRATTVQAIVDGSDSSTAALAAGYAEAVVLAQSELLVLHQWRRMGAGAPRPPLDYRPRVWYNPDLQSRNFIVPGLIAVIMMVIAALLTSLTVAREWERGTMESLIATPLSGPELILGKLVPYLVLGLVDVGLAVTMGEFLFEVPLRGSAALVFALCAVFLTGGLAMGMLFGILTRNQLVASQMAIILTFLPAFLLSGFVYAISNMPTPVRWFTYLVPARYLVTVLRAVYLKGVGLEILFGQALLLVVFAVAMVALANRRFRKTLPP